MKRLNLLLTSILLAFFMGFSQQDFSGDVKTFLIQNADIRISIETYKEKDGWTPLIISLGELGINLWMSSSGEVTEQMVDRDIDWIDSLFRIDLVSEKITFTDSRASDKGKKEDSWSFIVTESNPVRTRILIQGNDITSKLILDGSRKKAELFLFGGRVPITKVGVNIKNVTSVRSEIQLFGPSILTYTPLIYDRLREIIYFQRYGQEKEGIVHVWAKRIK